MSLRAVCCALLLPISFAHGQTVPLVDHHQHLFSPATVALVSPKPLPPVDLPRALDSLVRARGRAAQDTSALRDVYADDVVLMLFAERRALDLRLIDTRSFDRGGVLLAYTTA